MADSYIDPDETRLYGDYAVEQIARHVAGRLREFDPALELALSTLRSATEQVAAELRALRTRDPVWHAALDDREHCIAEARDVLLRFARHLESHRAGSVPLAAFFAEAPSVLSRRGPQRLLAALDHIRGTLSELAGLVRDEAYWQHELSTAGEALTAVLARDRALRSRVVTSPGLEAARSRWLAVYDSTKHLAAAVLGLSGSRMPLEDIFDDLAAHHRAEGVTDELPAEAPEPVPEPAPALSAPDAMIE